MIRHLEHLGLLDERTVLAHCVWLDDEEIEILARRRVTVAHNPMSNLKLASGFARIADMLAAGVRVTVGTDGARRCHGYRFRVHEQAHPHAQGMALVDQRAQAVGVGAALVEREAVDDL